MGGATGSLVNPFSTNAVDFLRNGVKKISEPITIKVTNSGGLYNLFAGANVLEDISNITFDFTNAGSTFSCRYMFSNAVKLPKEQIESVIQAMASSEKKPNNLQYAFQGTKAVTSLSLAGLDTQQVGTFGYCFNNCSNLVTLNLTGCNFRSTNNMTSIVANCTALTTILGGFQNVGQNYGTSASSNYAQYTINLSASTNLTHDSLVTVINSLYDIATAGTNTQSLVLGSTNLAKLSSTEIAVATNKGWSVS